jgi:hypothetical protein
MYKVSKLSAINRESRAGQKSEIPKIKSKELNHFSSIAYSLETNTVHWLGSFIPSQ